MKKIIALSSAHYEIRNVYTDSYNVLFNLLCEKHGFEFRFTDSLRDITADLFLIQGGLHSRKLMEEASFFPSHIKVILYTGAMQGVPRSNNLIAAAFERADYIISNGVGKLFRETWPEYVYKFEVFPPFFAPYKRYMDLKFNKQPLMRCLFTGSTNGVWYPLRKLVADAVLNGASYAQMIDIMRHPRWKTPHENSANIIEGAMFDAYAKVLNKYFCSFVGTGNTGGCPAKCFESAAAGALLLAETTPDVLEAGFIPNKHYVPVDKTNVFEKIKQCLAAPEKYRDMRLEGREYVRTNHSAEKRAQRIDEILEGL